MTSTRDLSELHGKGRYQGIQTPDTSQNKWASRGAAEIALRFPDLHLADCSVRHELKLPQNRTNYTMQEILCACGLGIMLILP